MNQTIVAALISEGSRLVGMWLRSRPLKVRHTEPILLPQPRKMTLLSQPEEESEDQQSSGNVKQKVVPLVTTQEIAAKLSADEGFGIEESQDGGVETEMGVEVAELDDYSESGVIVEESKATAIATGCIPCAIGHVGTCSGLINEAVRFAHSDGMVSNEVIDRVGICLDELNGMEREDLRPAMIINLPPWEKEMAQRVLAASRQIRHRLEAMASVESLEEAAAASETVRLDVWRDWIKKKMNSLTPEEQERVAERLRDKLLELAEEEEE